MFQISARKQSSDPVQEHLRESKQEYNAAASSFISALIALKKALNGRPVSELSLGKGDIRNPLPEVVPNLLERLSAEYEKLTQQGKSIVQEQLQYAETRHKPQEHLEQAQPVQPPQQADDGLNKEASNLFSRLLTYVSTPFRFGDEDRWERKNILQAAVEIDKKLEQIGTQLVSSDDNSIPDVVYNTKILMNMFQHNIVKPILDLNTSKIKKLPEKSKDEAPKQEKPSKKQKAKERKSKLDEIKSDLPIELPVNQDLTSDIPIPEDIYQKIISMKEDVESNIIPNLTHIIASVGLEEGKVDPGMLVPMQELISQLNHLIPDFFTSIQNKDDPNIIYSKYNEIKSKFNTIFLGAGKLKLIQSYKNDEIQKFAKGRFKRWLGRQRLSLFKQQDHRLRLSAESLIKDAEESIDGLMNILQAKNAPMDHLMKKVTEFAKILSDLLKNVMELGDVHNSAAKLSKMKAKTDGTKFKENIISETDIRSLDKFNRKLDELNPKEEDG